MSQSAGGSGRSRHRRSVQMTNTESATATTSTKSRQCIHVLFSCCVFFGVLSVCLIAALVFVGKHFYYNDVRLQIAAAHAQERSTAVPSMARKVVRLPKNVLPLMYSLQIHPIYVDNDFRTFNASVNITVRVLANSRDLMLHSHEHVVDDVQMFIGDTRQRIGVKEFRTNMTDETLTIIPAREIVEEELLLIVVRYHGLLRGSVGFYRSSYRAMNVTRVLATTKFQPTYARQAFPCFDEPNLKATFTLNVIKPPDPEYIVLSNMPIMEEVPQENGGVLVTFEKSVKMSTYLFCFIVCDFKAKSDVIESTSFGVLPYRVFATPGQLNRTAFATMVGKRVMRYFLDYFRIAFPLPKLDMVAIPDYVSGATEHWGVVTFRESALLYDEETSSVVDRHVVAKVVAHELSHSWFGNLVTMTWWDDIWLNEGFARYMEYKGVNAVFPDWQILDQFPVDCMHAVLQLDATTASNSVVQEAETPDEITQLFSTITYSKGAAILRMLESVIGEEAFLRSITKYLQKYAFANAVTQNLLDEFPKANSEFLKTWIYQKGFPIVTAKRTPSGFRLTQRRFLIAEKKDPIVSPFKYRWTIPITYITAENRVPEVVWFNHNDSFVDINIDTTGFVKFNPGQMGYYRLNYDLRDWYSLAENIRNLSVVDRAHLIEESFRIAEATEIPYDIPLNLCKYLREEYDYIPWAAANIVLRQIVDLMKTSKLYADLQNYVLSLVLPVVEKQDWNVSTSDTFLGRRLRATVLGLACAMEDTVCLETAQEKMQLLLKDDVPITPDLKGIVFKYGMKNASEEDWKKLWSLYRGARDANVKNDLMVGLTSIRDANILSKLLQLAEDDTYIRAQDYPRCVRLIAENPVGQAIAWNYVKTNWSKLVQRFGNNDRNLHGIIVYVSSHFATPAERDELLEFFAANPEVGAGENARRNALEITTNNINWLKRNKKSIEKWIEKKHDSTTSVIT